MKVLIAFLVGVLIGVGSFCGYIVFNNRQKPQVLSDKVEKASNNSVETLEPSIEPTTEPNVIPSPKISPSPTNSPKPSIKPTPKPTTETHIPPPTPTVPTATPDVWSPPEMEPLFAQYAGMYSVDKNTLERIANCESHFNPNAKNGDYLGMFQFATSSWQSNRNLMGLDNNPEFRKNIEESIKTAAFLLSRQGTSPWPSCI